MDNITCSFFMLETTCSVERLTSCALVPEATEIGSMYDLYELRVKRVFVDFQSFTLLPCEIQHIYIYILFFELNIIYF